MTVKVFKALWFLSLIIFLAVFMYNYASLPEVVTVVELEESPLSLSRDGLFYGVLLIAAILNVFVFIVGKLFTSNPDFRSWFYGLIMAINVFLLIGINFITLYNSSEKFDYQAIGPIIYGSLILVLMWSVAWPIYLLSRRIFFKRSV
jgi:hypothetical protein